MTSDRDREIVSLRRELARLRLSMEGQLRENERIWSGFQRIEIGLLGAQSLRELLAVLIDQFTATFPGVDCVSLACVDPEYELTRLLTQGEDLQPLGFVPLYAGQIDDLLPAGPRPYLGACPAGFQALLFPSHSAPLGSVAIAPLMLHGRVIGMFNQGSADARHFTPVFATDLLEHLAAVTAMCIDNAVNRERLRRDGLTDALTGVANRRFFERRLREEVCTWERHRDTLACLLVDLDHFKQVNDRHGHPTGDRALKQVAGALSEGLRSSDVLARYGGEEFVLLLPGTVLQQAQEVAQRLRANVARLSVSGTDNISLQLTVSIGLACLAPDTAASADVAHWLVQQADSALYLAKAAGRNQVVVAADSLIPT
jgi:two-component system, cell cycle response regulator